MEKRFHASILHALYVPIFSLVYVYKLLFNEIEVFLHGMVRLFRCFVIYEFYTHEVKRRVFYDKAVLLIPLKTFEKYDEWNQREQIQPV